jgi:putative ubiquitin-RnfH superfamily antitoxin RatB of RatAB toxin-antitoxin module
MRVEVAYVSSAQQYAHALELPEGASIRMALEYSGVLLQFPEIDLTRQKVGIFGKIKPLTTVLVDGDRVEIYRAVTADPATTPRRKVEGDEDDEEI